MMRLSLSSRISSSSPSSPALKNTCGPAVGGPGEERGEVAFKQCNTLGKNSREETSDSWSWDRGTGWSVGRGRRQFRDGPKMTGKREGAVRWGPKDRRGLSVVSSPPPFPHLGVAKLVLVVVNVQGAQQLLCPFPAVNELALRDGCWVQDAVPGEGGVPSHSCSGPICSAHSTQGHLWTCFPTKSAQAPSAP